MNKRETIKLILLLAQIGFTISSGYYLFTQPASAVALAHVAAANTLMVANKLIPREQYSEEAEKFEPRSFRESYIIDEYNKIVDYFDLIDIFNSPWILHT